jgi:hypothetical protein
MKIFHTWSKFLIVIFKLIIHASAIFMIMLIIYCIKTNPDWKITNNKTYYINYTVKSDVYDLRNFSNEITSIVRKYKSDAKLVNIAYILKDKYTGVIFLYFFQKNYKNPDKSYCITISVGVSDKKISTFEYYESSDYDGIKNPDELTEILDQNLTSIVTNYNDTSIKVNAFNILQYDSSISRFVPIYPIKFYKYP